MISSYALNRQQHNRDASGEKVGQKGRDRDKKEN